MGQNTLTSTEAQAQRLKIKQIGQQMANLAVSGAGLSTWEARELVRLIDEIYFCDPDLKQLLPGQTRYSCVDFAEPPGKSIKDCRMKTVVLTLFQEEDDRELPPNDKDCSIAYRWARLSRSMYEDREPSRLLSWEE